MRILGLGKGTSSLLMPLAQLYKYTVKSLRGPTCKIARFQAELKFSSWIECGKTLKANPQILQRVALNPEYSDTATW